METLRRDLLVAVRSWRRSPGAVAAASVALALGIGVNTIFSIVSGVLLEPLRYPARDRLVMVWQDLRPRGGPEKGWAPQAPAPFRPDAPPRSTRSRR